MSAGGLMIFPRSKDWLESTPTYSPCKYCMTAMILWSLGHSSENHVEASFVTNGLRMFYFERSITDVANRLRMFDFTLNYGCCAWITHVFKLALEDSAASIAPHRSSGCFWQKEMRSIFHFTPAGSGLRTFFLFSSFKLGHHMHIIGREHATLEWWRFNLHGRQTAEYLLEDCIELI